MPWQYQRSYSAPSFWTTAATIFALGAVFLAAKAVVDGNPAAAIVWLISGGLAYWLLSTELEAWNDLSWQSGVAVCAVLGIGAAFFGSPFADKCYLQRNAKSTAMFVNMAINPNWYGLSRDQETLATRAIIACGTQNIMDSADLAVSLQKALRFGPTTSIADGVVSSFSRDERQDCSYYRNEMKSTKLELTSMLGLTGDCLKTN